MVRLDAPSPHGSTWLMKTAQVLRFYDPPLDGPNNLTCEVLGLYLLPPLFRCQLGSSSIECSPLRRSIYYIIIKPRINTVLYYIAAWASPTIFFED